MTKRGDPCTMPDCAARVIARGVCQTHYRRLRTLERNIKCAAPECPRLSEDGGYCNAHYLRQKNHGYPLGGRPGPNIRKVQDFPDGTRICTQCGERKRLEQYDQDRGNASLGRRSQCKICRGAKVAAWYQANKERQRERARERLLRDADKIRENDKKRYQRHRSKRIALATDNYHKRRSRIERQPNAKIITDTGLRKFLGDQCCYCDTVMVFDRIPGTQYNPTRATIEHITPLSKGGAHDWHNCVLACRQCNMRKNNMPVQEFVTRLGARARGALSQAVIQQLGNHPEPS